MKERPILFKGDMVRAILDGRKTQTRRIVKPQQKRMWGSLLAKKWWYDEGCTKEAKCPYGKPGDRLWVRETFGEDYNDIAFASTRNGQQTIRKANIVYRADGHKMSDCGTGWKPSIHMPRYASRILLEITDIRVERVQDISVDDCLREGIDMETEHGDLCINIEDNKQYENSLIDGSAHKTVFKELWDSINKKRGYGWDVNPWVWVIEFKRLKP